MSPARPPRWARRLADRLLPGPAHEIVRGDLEEMYARSGRTGAPATWSYLRWVLGSALYALRLEVLDGLRSDVIVALRQFRRRPGVYGSAALVLAVGLGVATLTWGVRYGALGRPLPVSEPDRVVNLLLVEDQTRSRAGLTIEHMEDVARALPSIEEVGAWIWTAGTRSGEGEPAERVDVYRVTPGFFRIMEITPLHGRLILDADAAPGAPRVTVLGHDYWQTRFDADPGVLGTSLRLDGEPVEIVGVLPPGVGLTAQEDLWIAGGTRGNREARRYEVMVRLAPGATLDRVEEELRGLADRQAEAGAPRWMGTHAVPLRFDEVFYTAAIDTRDRVLWSGGILLFVMALANVANLFLVATRRRAQELAIRRALGAARTRVVRQLLVESLIPALVGFAGAAAIAAFTLARYQVAADAYGRAFIWEVYRLERPHLILLAAGALASTVFVSLVTAHRELRGDGAHSLRRARGGVKSGFAVGRAFLGVEVAVGAALLLVASLMTRSAWNQRHFDFGFASEDVMTADVQLRGDRYADPTARIAFWTELQAELERIAGVREATVGAQLPLIRCCQNRFRVEVDGDVVSDPLGLPLRYVNAVDASYFDTFDAPPLEGRDFDAADAAGGSPVAIVNTPFVARHFAGESALGRRVRVWRDDGPGPWRTIVGVAPHLWMDTDVNQTPEGLYLPLAQSAPMRASFAIRVQGDPDTFGDDVRASVRRVDPEQAVTLVRTMPQLFRDRTSLYRREGPLFTLLGSAGLLLAVVGLYAVVSYLASLSVRELGLRAALGAGRPELIWRSVRGVAMPTALGSVVGLGIGLFLTRGFERFVFMVDPWDPRVAVATVVLLAGCATAASLGPALRASRTDPARTLSSD